MFSINTAIIGAGFMGPAHTEALRRIGVNVIGILGVDDAETTRAAENLCISKAYKSYDEVLTDDEVQAVHITTPNKLHFEMAKAALEAGIAPVTFLVVVPEFSSSVFRDPFAEMSGLPMCRRSQAFLQDCTATVNLGSAEK